MMSNERLRELDGEGVAALFDAAADYHKKHSKGAGGAAVCVCGAGCGGSKACRGLALVRDLFRYSDFDSHDHRKRFEYVQQFFQ